MEKRKRQAAVEVEPDAKVKKDNTVIVSLIFTIIKVCYT